MNTGKLLSDFFQAIVDAMLVIVHWVLWIGPVGVFALAFVVGARAGLAAAGALAHYLVLLSLVQVLLIVLIYPAAVLAARLPLRQFARAVLPAQAMATSTQSSLACLPAMVEAAQQLRIPRACQRAWSCRWRYRFSASPARWPTSPSCSIPHPCSASSCRFRKC